MLYRYTSNSGNVVAQLYTGNNTDIVKDFLFLNGILHIKECDNLELCVIDYDDNARFISPNKYITICSPPDDDKYLYIYSASIFENGIDEVLGGSYI